MQDRSHLLLIPIAAALAVLPLILHGPSCGHDFEFHVLNWLEVGAQWKQGVLQPHWEFTCAWNSGEPRFVFYPPLSWTAGALLGLALPWIAVPATFIWLALTASGFTMHRLAREWAGEGGAVLAAYFYMVHPYMLFTFYERSAYAELLAAAWVPMLLLGLLRARPSPAGIAIPVALLWLTNDPAAVMGCYTVAILAVVRVAMLWRSRGTKAAFSDAATVAMGTCLGMGLAGFYLLPATYEQRWVHIGMAAVPGTRVEDNFLFGQFGSASHRAILRAASLCSVALLVTIAVIAAFAVYRSKSDNSEREAPQKAIISLALLAGVLAFLLTAPAAILWRHAPELKYLQFPWRFNVVLGASAAALLGIALRRVPLKPALFAGLLLIVAMTFSGDHVFRQFCSRGNGVETLAAEFMRGQIVDSTDGYTPSGSNHDAIGHANPSTWLADVPTAPPPTAAAPSYVTTLSSRLHFKVDSPVPRYLVINLRDYPAWQATVNGIAATNHPWREDGLMVLPLPGGVSTVDLFYNCSWDYYAGWTITVVACCILFFIRKRHNSRAAAIDASTYG